MDSFCVYYCWDCGRVFLVPLVVVPQVWKGRCMECGGEAVEVVGDCNMNVPGDEEWLVRDLCRFRND
jgi:Zn finger protein HypA/HybF involved in hydrogenase expression